MLQRAPITAKMKRVLMIAYHFPPLQGSSGVQRTLRFVRHLPEFGWEPLVLTAHPRAYPSTAQDQMADIPAGTCVTRAAAWDTAHHFAIAGRYPGMLARPDRWISWWLGAIPSGLRMITQHKPNALWSTYPIATAHRIGRTLQRLTRLPWIADFRDPMAQDDYPEDPATWRSFAQIERDAVHSARYSTFTTPSAVTAYRERYPARSERITLLENGYDEETFANAPTGGPLNPGCLTVLHSGVVYPSERDPRQLFAALRLIKVRAPDVYGRLRVRFRAAVHEPLLRHLASENAVEAAVEILPPVGYAEALAEMLRAEGLLVLQASNCNAQIPAKLYEYLRARRPILTLADPAGDTAGVTRSAGIDAIAPLDDAEAIAGLLSRFVGAPLSGTLPSEAVVSNASRRGRARQLAALLDSALRE